MARRSNRSTSENAFRTAFAQALQDYLSIRSGPTREEVAGSLGVTTAMISYYLAGKATPSAHVAFLACSQLGLVINYKGRALCAPAFKEAGTPPRAVPHQMELPLNKINDDDAAVHIEPKGPGKLTVRVEIDFASAARRR